MEIVDLIVEELLLNDDRVEGKLRSSKLEVINEIRLGEETEREGLGISKEAVEKNVESTQVDISNGSVGADLEGEWVVVSNEGVEGDSGGTKLEIVNLSVVDDSKVEEVVVNNERVDGEAGST